MSATETQEVLLETEAGTGDGDSAKLVPVAESIRYRKRAQGAEKKAEAAAAGTDQYICGTNTTTLAGNDPSTGTGTWT